MIGVAITGPESTGKSTLAEALAKHYNSLWVPEFAREYIDRLSRPYVFEDVEKIAQTQIEKEEQIKQKTQNIFFSDTDLLVIKIWMEHKFNRIPDWLETEIERRKYDLYLLCDIDIPWEYDPQREHPDLRKYFFDLYEKELQSRGFNYIIISGNEKMRFQSARREIDKLL